jgi:hypothetical protein
MHIRNRWHVEKHQAKHVIGIALVEGEVGLQFSKKKKFFFSETSP